MTKILRRTLPPDTSSVFSADIHPVLQRVFCSRHIHSAKELDNTLAKLHLPSDLLGMDGAVELLSRALTGNERITIVGDFDADGATSSALMLLGLRAMGAKQVDYLVPNRFDYGYGLTPEIVEVAAKNRPDLIVTVDNGISSIDGVARAQALGIRVLVTDHHLPGNELPQADAMINPNQPGDTFPSKYLAGVGVAFYVLSALRGHLRKRGDWFDPSARPEPNLAEFLDLVALGTVADLVPLDQNNRILVEQGLKRIRAGRARPGIRALLELARRKESRIVASDLGFAVGPRLNAAGRLDDMSVGIECLTTDDPGRARELATQLDSYNQERKEIETDMKEQALAHIQQLNLSIDELPLGLCLYNPDWHQGVIGILASRIKEQFHRPVIAFASAGTGELKGSARSIPGLHIRDVLDAVAAQHPDVLQKFGGHAMAAGLSLSEQKLDIFREAFEQELAKHLQADQLTGAIETDGELQANEFTLELAELLRTSSPWGQGFPEPVFDGIFHVIDQRIVGERHLKLTVRAEQGNAAIAAIAFNQVPDEPYRSRQRVRIVYRLNSNEYRGVVDLQLMVEHIEKLAAA